MDEQAVTKAVRAALDDQDVEVTLLEGARVPGLAVFSAEIESERGGYATGVVTPSGEVHFKLDDTTQRVMEALGPDAPAGVVATVVGFLEGTREPTYPVDSQARLDGIGKPEWARHVTLPQVSKEADGSRVYEYWVECGEPPLWRTRLTVSSTGQVSMTQDDIWEITDDDDDED